MIIYHYTKGENIPKILKSDDKKVHLWFTRSDCLNDSSEGDELYRIIDMVLNDKIKNGTLNYSLYNAIKEQYNATKDSATFLYENGSDIDGRAVYSSLSTECYAFICSFSNDDDSLDLWRYYSKGDVGYALGFDRSLMEENIKRDEFETNYSTRYVYKPYFIDVVYDDKEKVKIIDSIIKECLDLKSSNNSDENFAKLFCIEANKKRFVFKHSSFSNEKEIRCVLNIPADRKLLNRKEIDTFQIKYRSQNGEIIPYLEIEFDSSSFRNVRISPLASDFAVRLMKEYYNDFCERNSAENHVKKSTLPLRF